MRAITFDDETHEHFVDAINAALNPTYVIAVGTADNEIVEGEGGGFVDGQDVSFVATTDEGLSVRDVDENGEPISEPRTIPWVDITRVHIY